MTTETNAVEVPIETRFGRAHPVGFSRGSASLIAAWVVGLAIVRLTGAAAVVLMLVVSAVALLGAAASGWLQLRRLRGISVIAPPIAEAGADVDLILDAIGPATATNPPLVVRHADRDADRDTDTHTDTHTDTSTGVELDRAMSMRIVIAEAGTVTSLPMTVSAAGRAGLVWWRRRIEVVIEPMRVAPTASGPMLPVGATAATDDGTTVAGGSRHIGDIDGVRPWRPGESDQAIHWPSTVRSGRLIAHDRTSTVESRWTLSLRNDPGRLRWTLERGIRLGHEVYVSDPDSGQEFEIRSADDAARWATVAADVAPADCHDDGTPRWWRRSVTLRHRIAESTHVRPLARWWTGLASAIALNMLLGALGASLTAHVLATAGIAVGASVSVRFRHGQVPTWIRVGVTMLTLGALLRIVVQEADLRGLVEILRGPMPDLLMLLLVLHGAECIDRRTNRVHLAIAGVIVAYAAGLRLDDGVGWWLLAWSVAAVAAVTSLPSPEPHAMTPRRIDGGAHRGRRHAGWAGWLALGALMSFGLASIVPVPAGPASLGLPALSGGDADGTLDGSGGDANSSRRGALDQVGGYPGFSETMDTSMRGDLGDEIVMRVRAPEPAFWRGQTFTDFDGRFWRVADVDGPRFDGPRIGIEPTVGDLPADGVRVEEFVQTYHVEADLPNVVFAASRPDTVVFDGALEPRPDGSIRADRRLTAGTIYTVVSQRVQTTPAMLHEQGDIAQRFAAVADPRARPIIDPYLALPATVSDRTLELAEQLEVPGSTYETVMAYQRWIAETTVYDLDAPVPREGADAVDDHLFVSQRGFCEQIASSLVVMLRSRGIPTRVATGYIPGERDQVSGVWKVRASDAHAWAEVWFPDTGWEAFDPTASVPLAGDVDAPTVGDDAAGALFDSITSNPIEVALVVVGALAVVLGLRRLDALRRRRERGDWGVLHDRFVALARSDEEPGDPRERRVPLTTTAAANRLVDRLRTEHDASVALPPPELAADVKMIAETLDRVAFDPTFGADAATTDNARDLERRLDAVEAALGRRGASRRRASLSAASS